MRRPHLPAALSRLLITIVVTFAAVTLAYAASWAVGEVLNPSLVIVMGLVIALVWWIVREINPQIEPVRWRTIGLDYGGPSLMIDRRSRRLAGIAHSAQPGRRFTSHNLANVLNGLVTYRLIRDHGADPGDPLRDADRLLSPPLLAYIRTAETGGSPPVKRATLDAYLKEIDSL